MCGSEISDPHTLVFDQQNNIWFTAQHSNAIAMLDTLTSQVRFVTANQKRSRPYGIEIDSQNRPWSVLVGTNKIAMVDPKTFELIEIALPHKNSRPRRLVITKDDTIWYVDFSRGYLGHYDPKTHSFNEWEMPSYKASNPYGMALDSNGRLWIAETGQYPNNIVVFDTKQQKFISSTPVTSGGSIRHMYYDSKRDRVWFGVDTGYISNISLAVK